MRCKFCHSKLSKEDIMKVVDISMQSEPILEAKSLMCPVCGNILLKKEYGEVF